MRPSLADSLHGLEFVPLASVPSSIRKRVSKVSQTGSPILLEAAENLDAAISRVIALRENVPGEYLTSVKQQGGKSYSRPTVG
jgi:hypothetical protein